jgi:chorismate dehydratase
MNRKRIKIGSVSYLNSKPLIHGFVKGVMEEEIELIIDYPSAIATQLIEDKIDIGLVPVAIIPQLPEYHIVTDYCIGCNGEVATVCLFSDVPVEQITTVLLDYQSRTSVELLKILLKDHWKISPTLINGNVGYEKNIRETTAGLVIGDRAFDQRLRSKFIYDLGKAWKDMTGLPFVFAAWIANKKMDPTFLHRFNSANKRSLDSLEEILQSNRILNFDIEQYFTKNIDYHLDTAKRGALKYFLEEMARPTIYQTGSFYNA